MEFSLLIFFSFLLCVLCTQCCQFLWIVHCWFPLRFSLTFAFKSFQLHSKLVAQVLLSIPHFYIVFRYYVHFQVRAGGVMVFNATFNNLSVISWRSVLLLEELGVHGKTTDLSQVTGKLYHINSSRGIFTNAIIAFGRSSTNNKSYFKSIKLKLCDMYEDS